MRAQASDAAGAFVASEDEIRLRPRTSTSMSWTPTASAGERSSLLRSPDLSALVQEVVNRPGWVSGSPLALIVSAPDSTAASLFTGDRTTSGTVLHVEYLPDPPPPEEPPVGVLTLSQAAAPSLTVSADGVGSSDGDATPIASYEFDFGDGSPPVTVNAPVTSAQHTYAASGTYLVTLVVIDTGGNASSPVTSSVTVTAPDAPPVAALALSQPPTPALAVSADGAGSTDGDATPIASYRFDFGDGSAPVTVNAPATIATHAYASVGPWTVTLIATDTGGNPSAPVTKNITLQPEVAPTAQLAVSQLASPALTVSASGAGSTDADLTPIASYRFDFGDGSAAVTVNSPANATQHTYATAGSYTVTLIATDTGGNASAPATFPITVAAPDAPPVAALALSQPPTPALTVRADGSGSTDGDATPIANYRFDFGDGSAAVTVNAPATIATHAYASVGPWTVTLIATDTGGNPSAPVTKSITLQPEVAPTAQLAVSQLASPALTVSASGAGSTDADLTPIASYRFDFGDGSAAVTVNAPTNAAQHTYAAAGSYTVTLIATDTGGNASAPVSKSIAVAPPILPVSAGYYDTHHTDTTAPKPDPWKGSPGVVFVGTADSPSGGWDSSALKIDNPTGATLGGVVVSVDIGSHHYALWGTNSIPAGQSLILAQTAFENFDGSDTNPAGCFGCDPSLCLTQVRTTVPVIHVTFAGTTTDYFDTGQVLNTHGVDAAGCPATGGRNDESHVWTSISTAGAAALQSGAGADGVFSLPVAHTLLLAAPAPNPARGEVVLRFNLPERGPVTLGLYDVAGRLVRTCLDRELEAGSYIKGLDLTGVQAGVYFCDLRTRAGSVHRSIVVSH